MAKSLADLISGAVSDGTVPGAVALVARADGEPEIVTAGLSAVGGPPIRGDAIVRIQSMTKAITAVAALRLVADGRLGLDDAVDRWLPELADRRVLSAPTAALDDTVPASDPITVRTLLTNTSGYGWILEDSPLRDAMLANGTESGPEPVMLGADEWLSRMAELPLAFQPGTGWRYHHSFGILGILLSRLTGVPLGEHLRSDLFEPLGMIDTGFAVPTEKATRLPAAYRHEGDTLFETEPAGGGSYVGEPAFDVSHGELVSTAGDYLRFLRALARNARGDEVLLRPDLRERMLTDQVPDEAKTPESFFPGFWDASGWGYGVGVQIAGAHAGRCEWSGGQGTTFFLDPDGTLGILLTQVEMGEPMMPLLAAFQEVAPGDLSTRG